MKIRCLLFVIVITICLSGYSQQVISDGNNSVNSMQDQDEMRTLFGKKNGKIENGGWGGFTLGYTSTGGRDAFLSGGRGGWLINHRFTLGGGGYGFVTDMNQNYQTPTIDNYSLAGGYGGLLLESTFAPFNPVHISIPVLIGGGGASVVEYQDYHDYSYSGCFVLETGIDIEFNIIKFFRIALNVSYRYTSDLSLDYYSIDGIKQFSVPSDAMRGFNTGLTMKFGKF